MFSHIVLGSNDIARSKRFYDALFAAIDGPEGDIDARGRLVYMHDGGRFILTLPVDGTPASAGNGVTVGFHMASREMTDAWHSAGTANGGSTAEDPPGDRETLLGTAYLAYLRDPDGNKLCAKYSY